MCKTTARDIADRAGVSPAAIGYHFGSTDELLPEAFAEAVPRWLEPLIGLISTVPKRVERDRFGAAIESFAATFSANRLLVLAYSEALLRAEHAGGLRSAMAGDFDVPHTPIATGITQLQAGQPRARRVDAEGAATLVMAVFDGLIAQSLVDPDRLPTGGRSRPRSSTPPGCSRRPVGLGKTGVDFGAISMLKRCCEHADASGVCGVSSITGGWSARRCWSPQSS